MPPSPFKTTFTLPPLDTAQMPVEMSATLCPSDRPLLLAPVRLETRFFPQPDGTSELRLRIYPDKFHIDAHEIDLTPAEREWGVHYWNQDWRAGSDERARASAWRQLAERFGAPRAAWIVRLLQPTNPQARPTATVSPETRLRVPPRFPAVSVVADGKDDAWRRAPLARLLPDRFVAIVQSAGRPVIAATGRDIERPLPVGPDPKAEPPDGGDQVSIDEGMKWMIDFDAAEEVGMGLRIPIPATVLADGIDTLFVFGTSSAAPVDAAKQVGALLDAHHYTDGLEFLREGTPSNNTADRRAGYSSDDAGQERSFATEIAFVPSTLEPASNAIRFAGALGLAVKDAPAILGHAGGAPERHDLDARSMNTALWQAGWGYFLTNMIGMDGTGLTPDDVAWAREIFVSHVRSAGPYAAIRCGRQPYGVLPVTSLDLWKAPAGQEDAFGRDTFLKELLVKLRDIVWRTHAHEAPRVGRRVNPPDADADLADVMRTDALPSGYRARSLLGRHYLQHLRAFLGENLEARGFLRTQDAITGDIVARLGFTWRPRVARATYADLSWAVSVPLIQAGEISPWRKLDPNYIKTLLDEREIAGLVNARPGSSPDGHVSLLHVLLRHAMLREYAEAAAHIAGAAPGTDLRKLLKDDDLIDLVPNAPSTPTWTRQLDLVVASVTGTRTIRQFLEGLRSFRAPGVTALGEFLRSLAHLQDLDTEKLQYLMQGTLDLAGRRLDAWITAFATKRLALMRAEAPQGVRVGAYGWVENLAPGSAPQTVLPPPAGEDEPVVAPADDTGFIHAPSLTHAATAALLRNAHLGADGTPRPDGPFAIDLSSRRARDAAWLLEGLRQEQPLGALLGYRLERRLHEMAQDHFIRPLRELAPLTARKLEQTTLPLETIAANNVVDGVALFNLWRDASAAVKAKLQQAGAGDSDVIHIGREIDALGDAIDSVADALTAEAAYQMVRGNTARTASTLKAIADGDAPPPELEVARTPRSGIAITHRVLVLFSGRPGPTTGWAPGTQSPRAGAEPTLNAWAARMLGHPTKIRCTVERLDERGDVAESHTFPLSELKLAPLDIVYGVEARADPGRGSLTDVEERVLYHARRHGEGVGAAARLRLQHARPANLRSGEITLFDAIEQARALRHLYAGARAAGPDDLDPPDRTTAGKVDFAQLDARIDKAEDALVAAHKALSTLVGRRTPAPGDTLRGALLALHAFGLAPGIPIAATGDDGAARGALLQQARVLLQESRRRVDRVAALRAEPKAEDPRRRRDRLSERARAVFGTAFTVLPRFKCEAAAARELTKAFKASTASQDGDPLAAHTWLIRNERVRDGLARLAAPLRGAEILATGERLDVRVAQLPFVAGERWVGLPPAEDGEMPAGKLSLVVQAPTAIAPANPLAGLWIDEWIEIVPSRHETTGLAFQFNPPDSSAPQNVLLAVPPDLAAPWTVAALHRVLAETLDLAKLRAVEMEALGEVAHYLPALFYAFNAQDEAVSSDFSPLTK